MKLLVAEDDRAVRTSLERALTLEGYDVATVKNGAEALSWLAADTADAVLLDVTMPVVDGLTVCRVLRGEGNRVPILMLTARADTGDRIAGLDAGADDYLPKPFDLGELLARIRALLRRAHDEPARPDAVGGTATRRPAHRRRRPPRLATRRRARPDEDRVRPPRAARPQRRDRPRPLDDLRADLELRLRTGFEEPRRVHRLPPPQDRGRRAGTVDPHGTRRRLRRPHRSASWRQRVRPRVRR